MDGSFIIRNTDITLPEVTGHHIIMHISDSHLCVSDDLSSEEERAHSAKRENDWSHMKHGFANAYGDVLTDANNVSTYEAFCRIMDYAAFLKPELLIITGDSLEYMHCAGGRLLKNKLAGYGRPFICVPGNHEDSVLDGVWDENISIYRGNGFTFAGIDNRRKTVSDTSLSQFSALINEGTPLFPVFHIPLCTSYNRETVGKIDKYYFIDENTDDENARQFVKLMSSPAINTVFCGHLHGFISSELYEGVRQISCSSSMIGNIHLIDIHG